MDDRTAKVAELLREAADTHHRVYRITDGADEDWASWYADWLTRLSELPDTLPRRPVRSELTCELLTLDRDYAAATPDQPWDEFYAQRLVRRFA